ncbi:unnamed protein product [Auanema sp. JU1783]|nr:unnamed protein product [Auanema sp. JU1783]
MASTSVPEIDSNNDYVKSNILPTIELVLGLITYFVIIAMTVVGNTLVVVAVFSYRPLKKVQNYFLVSLAASDLAVAIFVMPLHVVQFLADGRWLLGIYVCQFFTTADILLCTSSILNLCAIAIDRYCAIHDPINYAHRRSLKFVCVIIAIVWALSVLISVPPLIGWNDWSSQSLRDHCQLSTEKAFVIYSAMGSFFLPLLVMVIVYIKIFLNARQRIRTNRGRSALLRIQNCDEVGILNANDARRQSNRRSSSKRSSLQVSTRRSLDRSSAEIPMEMRKSIRNIRNKSDIIVEADPPSKENPAAVLRKREKISVAKERRAAKTIAVIIFVFSFCWLPFFTVYVILPFCESCFIHPKVQEAFTWLGYINSSLNPFLYGILNLEFRRAFKKILCPKSSLEEQRRRLSAVP